MNATLEQQSSLVDGRPKINLDRFNSALQIRNLNPGFSYQDRNEMLYGLGATTVHNYPYFTVAFFPDELSCHMIIRLLHQRRLNGRYLKVEYAKPEQIRRLPCHAVCDAAMKSKIRKDQLDAFRGQLRESKERSQSSSFDNLSNFCPNFPKATPKIINRIEEHLLNNTQFYNKVLLLMEQCGLEIPIDDDDAKKSTDEEIELKTVINPSDINQSKAPQFELERRKRKRKKLPTGLVGEKVLPLSVQTNRQTKPSHEIDSIFENKDAPKSKKLSINIQAINLNTPSKSMEIEVLEPTGFGLIEEFPKKIHSPPINDNNFDIRLLTDRDLISDEEIQKNLTTNQSEFSVFQNYSAGELSHRLYVKNIHRKVSLKDLHRLFAKFIDLDNDDHLKGFGVVYLEKGRMRGQAFVNYPTESHAQRALKSVNGFQFYEKPIVVAFARCKKGPME